MTEQEFKQLDYFQEDQINYTHFIYPYSNIADIYSEGTLTNLINSLSFDMDAGFTIDFLIGDDPINYSEATYLINTRVADFLIFNYALSPSEMSRLLTADHQQGLYKLVKNIKERTKEHKEYIIKTIKEL